MRLQADGRHVALTVSDAGPGISAELRERLFQPFSRGASAAPGGTGLGLSICLEIVDSLGGSITLDNRVRHGQVEGLDATTRLTLESTPHG